MTSRSWSRSDPAVVADADRVVLPGVGAFADCRRGLDAVHGMVDALEKRCAARARPFFGICVGMQLLAERGREYEVKEGLGWIAGEVDRITPSDPDSENSAYGLEYAQRRTPHPLLDGIAFGPQGLHAYFVHSYHLKPRNARSGGGRRLRRPGHGDGRRATIWSARNFIRKRASGSASALIANFLKWKP